MKRAYTETCIAETETERGIAPIRVSNATMSRTSDTPEQQPVFEPTEGRANPAGVPMFSEGRVEHQYKIQDVHEGPQGSTQRGQEVVFQG